MFAFLNLINQASDHFSLMEVLKAIDKHHYFTLLKKGNHTHNFFVRHQSKVHI